ERLAPGAADAIQSWRRSGPTLPPYVLPRRGWVHLPGPSFRLRTDWHVRLVRSGAAAWRAGMSGPEAPARRDRGRREPPDDPRFPGRKYHYLRRSEAGEFGEFVRAYREKRWADLFALRASHFGPTDSRAA